MLLADCIYHNHANEAESDHSNHAHDASVFDVRRGKGDECQATELEGAAGHLDEERVEGRKAETIDDYAAELHFHMISENLGRMDGKGLLR